MPRSKDGRWGAECKQCHRQFNQLRPGQEFCSQDCSNKAFPGEGGAKPAAGLEARNCANPECGASFQPYRANQVVCSRRCYKRLPQVRESNNAARRTPEYRERKNEWRRTAPAQVKRIREYNRKQLLARRGLTPDGYEQMLAAQDGKCVLCGKLPKSDGIRAESKLHVDHDHATGQSRDLLCSNCNKGLGCFRDDPAVLRAAADYVERHRERAGQ